MTALQTQNDPAAIAVAPGHGSINPIEDTKMNEETNNTAKPSLASRLLDIENMLDMVKNMNDCVFMACSDLGDRGKMNALHSVIDEIDNRIGIISEHLEEIRGALA